MAGPPIGVVPWKASCQSERDRPRIVGLELSWMVELPTETNDTLPHPTNRSPT